MNNEIAEKRPPLCSRPEYNCSLDNYLFISLLVKRDLGGVKKKNFIIIIIIIKQQLKKNDVEFVCRH